jgi:hypothetical protein
MADMQTSPKASLNIFLELLSWFRSQSFYPDEIFAFPYAKRPILRLYQGVGWARFGTKLARNTLPVVDGEPLTRFSCLDSDRSRKANLGTGTAILLTLIRLETGQAEHARLDVCVSAIGP